MDVEPDSWIPIPPLSLLSLVCLLKHLGPQFSSCKVGRVTVEPTWRQFWGICLEQCLVDKKHLRDVWCCSLQTIKYYVNITDFILSCRLLSALPWYTGQVFVGCT